MNNYTSYKIRNLSFVSTILVVILHAYNFELNESNNIYDFIQSFISHGIATIAVPIFFMISGFLFFYKFEPSISNWIRKYKSRFKSLFIPYIVWCTSWMIILYLIQLLPMGKSLFSNMVLSEFSPQEIFKYTYRYPIAFQLWYISALIECVIISPVIYYVIKKVRYISGPILISLWFFNILDYPTALFSIGCWIALNNVNLNSNVKKSTCIIITILFIVVTLLKAYLSYFEFTYLDLLGNLVILLGVISIWFIYDHYYFKNESTFNITKYAIFIYFFHEPLQSVIIRVFLKLFSNMELKNMITYLLSPILTIFICIIVGIFMDRYMNRFYKVLTGGR